MRHYLVRWGAISARRVSPGAGVLRLPSWVPGTVVPEAAPPALDHYRRQLLAAGLAQGQGRLDEACRLLGLSRHHLRAKLKRYLLTGAGAEEAQ
ncbi:MAG TPA: helix-turn-helix domain-containing protein [Thermoanaerobaculia bacterium]